MKIISTACAAVAFFLLALLLGGCGASMQARSVDVKKSLLVNPSILEKGTGDQALYRYVNPKTDIKRYSKIMIDPVLIEKEADLDANELENYQKLANNAYVYLTQELSAGLSDRADPRTRDHEDPDGHHRRRQFKARAATYCLASRQLVSDCHW